MEVSRSQLYIEEPRSWFKTMQTHSANCKVIVNEGITMAEWLVIRGCGWHQWSLDILLLLLFPWKRLWKDYVGKTCPSVIWHLKFHHYLMPVRMATTNKARNKKCWWGCEEMGTLLHWGGNVNCCSHYEKQCGESSENRNRSTIWSNYPTFEYLSKEYKKH